MQVVKFFESEKKAKEWASHFDFARAFSGLRPLIVEQRGDQWAVINPGNIPRTPVKRAK